MKITINNKEIDNIISMKSIFQLTKGLMFKKSGRALLVFPLNAKHSIWMACMKYSLDLIFIDENYKIVDIFEDVKPLTLNPKTWKTYIPKQKCRYVLEVESGLIKKYDLKTGILVKFNYITAQK